jgi:hypothetical protein
MAATIKRRPGEAKRIYWQGVVDSWRVSGLGELEFCRRHAIPVTKFKWWRKRVKSREQPKGEFIPLHVRSEAGFSAAKNCIEIVTAGGLVIRVPPGFDADTLARVVEVMEAVSCG